MLILLGGVSGSGKDTVKNEILKRMDNVVSIPSFTTRPIREGEIPGVTYNYVSTDEFKKLIENNELYEYDFHHNNYYGTSKKLLDEKIAQGFIIIKDIDVNGIENLKKIFQDNIKVVSIFLRVPQDELIDRLNKREDNLTDEDIEMRISRLKYEESKIPYFDYVIDNLDLEKTLNEIEDIIKKENL